MFGKVFIPALFYFFVCEVCTLSPCPLSSQIGSVISGQISAAYYQALVRLSKEEQAQCYNHTLPYEFSYHPEVAIAIHEMGASSSNHLYLSIKPLAIQEKTKLSFLIHTNWRYSQWQKITYSFLAEDRDDIKSGYMQVDSAGLGACGSGKKITVFVGFNQPLDPRRDFDIKHSIFLTGFEISTRRFVEDSRSPFQIQVMQSVPNPTGIVVVFSLTTITQVFALHVSYLAWTPDTSLTIITGNYMYQSMSGLGISHTPHENIGRNYARIHGVSGFIINNMNQTIELQTQWTGSKFHFQLGQSRIHTKYFSFSYIFFLGSMCSDCPGFPLSSNGKCVKYCPLNTYATSENVCIECGHDHFWNGTSCLKSCPAGLTLNFTTNQCECPVGFHWNEHICISCKGGKIFNTSTKTCQCQEGTKWNGFGCANLPDCTNGQIWNVFTYVCQCSYQTFWNGTYCEKKVQCSGGQFRNKYNKCQCPSGMYYVNGLCQNTGCMGGQVWNTHTSQCECERGYNFNGSLCIQCINGQQWNNRSLSCECTSNFTWNGNYCERKVFCSGNRVWNETYQQCICGAGQFWNGFSCMIKPQCCCGKAWNPKQFACGCPSSFNWDGNNCVLCMNGKVWDPVSKKCICQLGTQWNGEFCMVVQDCYGGMIWNQNTWSCQCPSSTVWNGLYCILNSCQGGQVWDNMAKKCLCVGDKIQMNGICVPPQKVCSNGKVWNNGTFSCQCPSDTYQYNSRCFPIPTCQAGKVLNPLNNQCECPNGLVWLSSLNSCSDVNCPVNQRWDGSGCVEIRCPPNSYFNGTECVCMTSSMKCSPWEYYDGQKCVYMDGSCPDGTHWNGTACTSINSVCPQGFYGTVHACKPFPQKCLPPSIWNGHSCSTHACPYGTYMRNRECFPYVPCQNNQQWDASMIRCVCPEGTEWNSEQCLSCSGGKQWEPFEGCKCATGYFFIGSKCERINNNRCLNVPNAFWDGHQCVCHEGFSSVGLACHCQGVKVGNRCDRCAHQPNSEWKFGQCQCRQGYTLYHDQCVSNSDMGNDNEADCNVGTFFDSQQKRCLACPTGCLSCHDSYSCRECRPEFNFDAASELCTEHCGDGRKFVLPCDDGNNNDGDGCSMDCKVQAGYVCRGGSPNSEDNCFIYLPSELSISQTGQVRYSQKILINLKLDYLPKALIQSQDCHDSCSNVLEGRLISGDTSAISIKSYFIPGTSFSFALEIDFDRPYIGNFKVQVGVSQEVSRKYFVSVRTTNKLVVDVVPAYLSLVDGEEDTLY